MIVIMIFAFFYDLILGTLSLPSFGFSYFFKNKYRASLKPRFGFGFPAVDKKNKPLIWIHAVSVGETRAIALLAKMLKEDYTLLISSITETGHEEAKRVLAFADYHVFLPLDLSFIIKPILKRVKPDFVIISETDLWFQFLKASKNNGAKIMLVNGKVSAKSAERLRWVPFFSKRLYDLIDFFSVQNKIYRKRFLALGVPSDKIAVIANLKFDEEFSVFESQELELFKKRVGIDSKDRVLVVGSTHDPEEKMILKVLKPIFEMHPNLKVLIVPRHPERFDEVEKELILQKVGYCRYSKLENCNEKIVLIDAMGLLRKCYSIATIAIVGGSFNDKIGGHNILEPLAYKVPVLFGPYMHSQPDFLEVVLTRQAGVQVKEEWLAEVLNDLLDSSEKRSILGESGFKLISNFKGSTKLTLNLFKSLFVK